MLLGGVQAGPYAPISTQPVNMMLRRRPRKPPPPPPCVPGAPFDIFTTAVNPLGTRKHCGGASPDIAVLHWNKHLLHHRTLDAVNTYERRLKDDRTVMVVEFDNFGDIGANGPFLTGATLPAPVIVLLGVGGFAVLWFGAKPAYQDVAAGFKNLRKLKNEQSQLRAKYKEAITELLGSDRARNITREQRRELLNLAVWLSLSLEEGRSEKIERIISGMLIAPGATLTGVGTFLAPGFLFGHSATLALLSNLFAGWVGNGPIAVFGVINAMSSLRTYRKAHAHLKCMQGVDLNKTWGGPMDLNKLVRKRQKLIKDNAVLTGVSSLGVATGGILTAVSLIGYAILIPFAILRAGAEYRERRKISYARRLFMGEHDYTTRRDLLSDMIFAQQNHDTLKEVKTHVRERYPWGYSAPTPFNMVVRAWAKMKNRHKRHVVPSAVHVQAAVKGLRLNQVQWLQRKLKITTGEHKRLTDERAQAANPISYDAKIAQQVALMQRLQVRIAFFQHDRQVLKADRIMDMHTTTGHAWVDRLINLFVEMQLFIPLAKTMLKDKRLKRSIASIVVTDDKKNMTVDAAKCLNVLSKQHLSKVWYEAFYGACEELLLTHVKLYYQELSRELSDLTVLRCWIGRHPDKSPLAKLNPPPPPGTQARAMWAAPAALPHPATKLLDSFVPPMMQKPATGVAAVFSATKPAVPVVTGAIFDAASVQAVSKKVDAKRARR